MISSWDCRRHICQDSGLLCAGRLCGTRYGCHKRVILGRPFLSTAKTKIDVASGEISFNIHGKKEKFSFKPRKEQCSMIHIKYVLIPKDYKRCTSSPNL